MKCFPLSAIILLFSFQAYSQNNWKGSVTLNGGSDFDYLGVEGHKWYSVKSGAKASFGYTGKVFFIEAGGDFDYKSHLSDVTGLTIKYAPSGKDTTLDISNTSKDVRVINGGGFLKSGWILSSSDKLNFDYTFKYRHDLPVNTTLKILGLSTSFEPTGADGDMNDINNIKKDHKAGMTYSHQFFKPGRTLSVRYDFSFSDESQNSYWHTAQIREKNGGGEEDVEITEKQYRITPQMYDYVNTLKVMYAENRLGNVDNLDAEFSLGGQLATDKDYQRAATLVGTEWRDSTSYHESFRFDAITVSPTVHMKYKTGCYGVDASYTPEFYTRRLNDEAHSGLFDYGFISHLVNIKNILEFKSMHRLSLVYDRSVKRPSYIQICWFERAGSQYSKDTYTGNPELLPEAKHKLNLSYGFTHGRFSITPEIGYEYRFRIIEQTYLEKKDEKGDARRVYSWINGGYSHTNSGSLVLAWKGKSLQGSLSGKINYFRGVAKTGNVTRSSDYSVNGEISYKLKTWEFLCRGKYESKIIRSYSSIDERIKLDMRVGKTFFKKFKVFIEALDIFDSPIVVSTMNANQTEERFEQINNKNKLFQMGVSFTF